MANMSNEQLSIFSTENENEVKLASNVNGANEGKIIDMPTADNTTTASFVPSSKQIKQESKDENGKRKEKKMSETEQKKIKDKVIEKKRTPPKHLVEMIKETNPETILRNLGYSGIALDNYGYYDCMRGHFIITNNVLTHERLYNGTNDLIIHSSDMKKFEAVLLYVDDTGCTWNSKFIFELQDNLRGHYDMEHRNNGIIYDDQRIINASLSKWTVNSKLHFHYAFLQSDMELSSILKKTNHYAYDFCQKEKCDIKVYFQAPQIEILVKAGYEFPRQIYAGYRVESVEFDCFNRLCKNGRSPKEIFKTSKVVYTTLKSETSLRMWDIYRKLDKFGRLNADSVQQAYDQGFNERDLVSVNSILNKNYNGKPVFNWETLINYLGRLDTFEAIDRAEAFMLLEDYLSMCSQLNIRPKIDGDSLKREHDVVARTIRQKRNEVLAQSMQKSCDEMAVYDYSEKIYSIRAIRNYDDLIDEACQQHNCVASYANRIASKQSLIYVMRCTETPNRSLVTVELTPDGKTIRQKFLAYNRSIRNKAQTEFLDRWLKHIATLNKK